MCIHPQHSDSDVEGCVRSHQLPEFASPRDTERFSPRGKTYTPAHSLKQETDTPSIDAASTSLFTFEVRCVCVYVCVCMYIVCCGVDGLTRMCSYIYIYTHTYENMRFHAHIYICVCA
jgi:hypothetical protein